MMWYLRQGENCEDRYVSELKSVSYVLLPKLPGAGRCCPGSSRRENGEMGSERIVQSVDHAPDSCPPPPPALRNLHSTGGRGVLPEAVVLGAQRRRETVLTSV